MDIVKYFESLTDELDAVKNKIRFLMDETHWLTDGEWKESSLRSVLRRHLPENFSIGKGFVFSPGHCSSQIDILIYDNACPVLFRDGDLVFVTPDAVRGVIEVKTKIKSYPHLKKTLEKLSDNAEFIRTENENLTRQLYNNPLQYSSREIFVGLFTFEPYNRNNNVLESLNTIANRNPNRIINHLVLGTDFYKYWSHNSNTDDINHWFCYRLDRLAPSFFIGNLLAKVSSSVYLNHDIYFPINKQGNFIAKKRFENNLVINQPIQA